jgi:beta-glucosidase
VHFGAGETKTVSLDIPLDILRIFDVRAEKMIVEGGVYTFMAGASSKDIRLSAECLIEGETLSPRGDDFSANMFDEHRGITLCYSKTHRCEYVRGVSWVNELSYNGLNLKGAKALIITACSMLGQRPLNIKAGGKEYELTLDAGSAVDDFKEYKIALDSPEGDTIDVSLREFTAIAGIKIVR